MNKRFKIFTAAFMLVLGSLFTLNANASVYEEGKSILQFGVGFGSPYVFSGSTSGIPPVHASFEYGVTDKIGVGGLVGYTSATWDQGALLGTSTYKYEWKFTYIIVGARAAYHFYNTDNVDLYGGIMLGYNVASASFSSTDPAVNTALYIAPSAGGIAFGGFLGGRYMFNEKFGVFAELGYNIAWISAGLSIKF